MNQRRIDQRVLDDDYQKDLEVYRRQQAEQNKYDLELVKTAAVLKDSLWNAKRKFDIAHMQDRSPKAKAHKLSEWRYLNADMRDVAHRLCIIEATLSNDLGELKRLGLRL